MQILVAEDDERLSRILRAAFEEENWSVTVTGDGRAALDLALAVRFDVLVLDVMLPRLDGFGVARRLRAEANPVPILMLTARDAESDVIAGLNLGADDYLTKPFSIEVLLARVRAVSRRGPIPGSVLLRVANLTLDTASRDVRRGDRPIGLTPREFSLLELLMRNKGRVVPRERLLEAVWGYDTTVEANTLEAFIRLLRNKVDEGSTKLIHTVRGIGYSIREPE